ncbi:ER membrane protein complex subunit 10-like [Paramacrobiotus metropolitanus]|uniref:ER membrane protein complex subunit 10-like n=1 Tax=Paramacrobiotus metropolitanus TaxID=2943436 RepID=UPI002445D81D|nr:ER membrane protein complex subunit 10-like [Paramacrobiotus metropolitanus]XP_055332878.1 ER membrane protein complex subunit 10-like [Paramacrobiotus metropolitanus]
MEKRFGNPIFVFLHFAAQIFPLTLSQSISSGGTLTFQHCFEDQLQFRCKKITELATNSLRINQTQSFTYQLSSSEAELLKASVDKDDYYFLRARLDSDHTDKYMQCFCKANDVSKSGLLIGITINVDAFGRVYAVEVSPLDRNDPKLLLLPEEPSDAPDTLTGLVTVHGSHQGPSPDLEGYKRKLAKEKAEKLAAETGDNRSFLAKYWMYIVPVVLFMLFSGQLGGQPGGAGGGGGAQ